jgi:riboflavin synthase
MFTGLIEEKGKIARISAQAGGVRLAISAPVVSADAAIGDSVSINGTCLTIVKLAPPIMEFDAVAETVSRTTIGLLRVGDSVNLERALRAGDRMGGHMVQGHIDGIGRVAEIREIGSETRFRFEIGSDLAKLLVEKGSIAVGGISLTIAEVGPNWFTVAVIPHTLASTTLGEASVGSAVNLETDIIGKYIFKYVERTAGSDRRLMQKLADGGFL